MEDKLAVTSVLFIPRVKEKGYKRTGVIRQLINRETMFYCICGEQFKSPRFLILCKNRENYT